MRIRWRRSFAMDGFRTRLPCVMSVRSAADRFVCWDQRDGRSMTIRSKAVFPPRGSACFVEVDPPLSQEGSPGVILQDGSELFLGEPACVGCQVVQHVTRG